VAGGGAERPLRAAPPLLILAIKAPLLGSALPVEGLHVLRQMISCLIRTSTVGAQEGALLGMAQLVLFHNSGGEAAVVTAVAAEQLQVLAVFPPQVEAALLPRGKLFAALWALVLVRPAVRNAVNMQVGRILKMTKVLQAR
jgi:hypothetical protein